MTMDVHHFDLVSQAFKRDPFPTFAKMRELGPLVRVRLPLIGASLAGHHL